MKPTRSFITIFLIIVAILLFLIALDAAIFGMLPQDVPSDLGGETTTTFTPQPSSTTSVP